MNRPMKRVKEALEDKGYMPTVKLNGSVNALEITSPYAQILYQVLKNKKVHVNFGRSTDSVFVFDPPHKFIPVVESL